MESDDRNEQDRDFRSAEIAHERRARLNEKYVDMVSSFGNAAMRAPALTAAGGIAALLGFYSANYNRLTENGTDLHIFNDILWWLLVGLLLTILSPGSAYFSQYLYTDSLDKEIFSNEYPYVHDTEESRWSGFLGHVFRWITIILVIGSILCLLRGAVLFLKIVA